MEALRLGVQPVWLEVKLLPAAQCAQSWRPRPLVTFQDQDAVSRGVLHASGLGPDCSVLL